MITSDERQLGFLSLSKDPRVRLFLTHDGGSKLFQLSLKIHSSFISVCSSLFWGRILLPQALTRPFLCFAIDQERALKHMHAQREFRQNLNGSVASFTITQNVIGPIDHKMAP